MVQKNNMMKYFSMLKIDKSFMIVTDLALSRTVVTDLSLTVEMIRWCH